MPLQQNVYQVNGLAEEGGLVDTSATAIINEAPACRVNGSAKVGGFVWEVSAPAGKQVNIMEKYVTNEKISSNDLVGFVYRVQDGALPCNQGATLEIANGQPCPVAIRGRFFAKSKNGATKGYKVLANTGNGEITTGSSAVANASAGTLEFKTVSAYTSWTAVTSGTLKLNVDGTVVALTGLDFHSASSLSDVASVLDTALTAVADVAANTGGTGLVFTSKTTGNSSKVSYIPEVSDIGTLLGASTANNMVETEGSNAQVDTGFVCKQSAAAGQLFIIERY